MRMANERGVGGGGVVVDRKFLISICTYIYREMEIEEGVVENLWGGGYGGGRSDSTYSF